MASTTPQTEVTEQSTKSTVCGECGATAKYTCPGCSARSCSLGCVKAHKEASGCSGTRNRTKLVFKEEMNNLTLLSDYRFLEEIDNHLEDNLRNRLFRAAKRSREEQGTLPPHLHHLRQHAARRGTTLNFMPSFFLCHRENTTRYHFKEGVIRWHIKWVFHQAEVTFIDHSVDENCFIATLLAKYLNPTREELSAEDKDKLAFYQSASYSRVSVLMKTDVEGTGTVFQELEPHKSIRVNFANTVITEYPVLYVVLRDHIHSYLDYQTEPETHDDLFSEIEGKEELAKDELNYFKADSDDMESE